MMILRSGNFLTADFFATIRGQIASISPAIIKTD